MSFFGRAANLIKGGIKSVGRGGDEAAAKERALAEELARMERPAPRGGATPKPAGSSPGRASDAPATPPAPERGPPERDEHGNVKRTL